MRKKSILLTRLEYLDRGKPIKFIWGSNEPVTESDPLLALVTDVLNLDDPLKREGRAFLLLSYAALRRDKRCIERLLEAGIDPNKYIRMESEEGDPDGLVDVTPFLLTFGLEEHKPLPELLALFIFHNYDLSLPAVFLSGESKGERASGEQLKQKFFPKSEVEEKLSELKKPVETREAKASDDVAAASLREAEAPDDESAPLLGRGLRFRGS